MTNNNKIVKNVNISKIDKIVKILFNFKKSKNSKFKILIYINIEVIKKFIFLNVNVKKNFNFLKQAFIKILIIQHFNL